MTTATASKTALYRVERRRARRQVRHGSTLLTAQMGFLAVILCSMALLRPLLSPADAPAAVHAWDSRMEALDGAHGSVWEGPDDFRRSLVESSRPPSPPPPDKCFATCEKEAFTTSDDTGFPDMWVTTRSAGENAYVACFQFFVILLTFLGLAVICDDYFMAALEAIVEAFGISEDVAGATWMAAGGSAPELSTSIMGVFFAQSDVGIGTIIGSAVFNVLFVIACCAFVAPNLRLSWWPLARDSCYYCLGITFLVAFMVDERVHIWEAIILLLLYGGYITVMKFNESLEEWVNGRITLTKQARAPWQKKILALFDMHLFNLFLYFLIIANTGVVFAELTLPSDTDCHNESEKAQARIYEVMNYVFSSIFALEMFSKWAAIGFFGYWRQPLNCFDGILVGLIFIEIGFSFMSEIVAETKAAENLTATDGADVGFVGAGRSLRVLRFFRIIRTLRVFRLYRAFHKHYADATTQVLPGDWHQTANGQLAKDSSGRSGSVVEQKVDAPPRASIAGESEEEEEEEEEGGPANPFDIPDSIGGKIFWLLGFPVSLAMFLSIPDCRRPAFKKLWPLTFILDCVDRRPRLLYGLDDD
jgi:Ca2+/Na+ antiporter